MRVTRGMGTKGDRSTAQVQGELVKIALLKPIPLPPHRRPRVRYSHEEADEEEPVMQDEEEDSEEESGDSGDGDEGDSDLENGRRQRKRAAVSRGAGHRTRPQPTRIQPRRVVLAPHKAGHVQPAQKGRKTRRCPAHGSIGGGGGSAGGRAAADADAAKEELTKEELYFEQAVYDDMRLCKGQAVYVLNPQGEANNAADEPAEDVCETCKRIERHDQAPMFTPDEVIECDLCCRGWHPLCLDPPMMVLPPVNQKYFCPDCTHAVSTGAGLGARQLRTSLTASERFLRGDYWMGRVEKILVPKRSPPPVGDPLAPTLGTCQVIVRSIIRPEDTRQGRQLHQWRREVFLSNELYVIDGEAIIKDIYPEALKMDTWRNTKSDDAFLLKHRYNTTTQVFVPIRGYGANSDSDADDDHADIVMRGEDGRLRRAVGWGMPSDDDDDDAGGDENDGGNDDEDYGGAARRMRRGRSGGPAPLPLAGGSVLIQGLGAAAVDKYTLGGGGFQMDDHRAGVRFGQLDLRSLGILPPAPADEEDGNEAGPSPDGAGGAGDETLAMLGNARQKLALSSIPKKMPCREIERGEIERRIFEALRGGNTFGASMYISGVPGTGKTATVKEVMRRMRGKARKGEINGFFYVEVNGLRLPTPKHAYTCILETLTGERTAPERAQAILDARFAAPAVQGRVTILFLDELDMLQTAKNSVLYNLFDWPSRASSKLVVIAVANTIDLPDRLPARIMSRMSVNRVRFNAYTRDQLMLIIKSRLVECGGDCVRLVDDRESGHKAVQLVCAKVANVSGDARRALELTRRAIEIMSARYRAARDVALAEGRAPPSRVSLTMDDVKQANREMVDSPHIALIRAGSLHERLFMVALALEARATGVEVAIAEHVAQRHQRLCQLHGIPVPPFGALLDVACRLGESQLVLCDSGKRRAAMRIRLTYSPEDVWAALIEEDDDGARGPPDMPWVKALGNAAADDKLLAPRVAQPLPIPA